MCVFFRISENIKIASESYRDQIMSPLDTAIYWVEYMARHDGAPQMQSYAKQLSFIQYHNIDVFAAFAMVVIGLPLMVLLGLCKIIKSDKKIDKSSSKHKGD